MGSIKHIYNKEFWKINETEILKGTSNIIYNITIGEIDDCYDMSYIKIWVLKDVYDSIMAGEYKVINYAYSEIPIKVLNKEKSSIDLLKKY